MKLDDPQEVESVCYQIRLADYPRSLDRTRIDELFNGWPPFSKEDAEKNHVAVNVNFLEGTRLAHDARAQFTSAFTKPGQYFTARTDSGPIHKRDKWGAEVTKLINRPLKRSLNYFETFRSKFALDVLHGIGPGTWPDADSWCPDAAGITDIGIPARTYLTMKNLPFFYIYRSFTAPELMKLTRGSNVDPGWNMELVDACLEWVDRETMSLMGSNWPEVWSPEKASERVKSDGGFYVGDEVPTLNAFDLYVYDEDEKESGWKRRIILDSWSTPQSTGARWSMSRKTGKPWDGAEGQFLYSSKNRYFAAKRENIMSFQFADLSAVAPFQYHSVRSLGFLLYAVCHLQNRLRSSFTEAVFENLLQMFRIKSMEDVQRALKLKIHGFSFIDDNLTPVPAGERFQPNMNLVQLGLQENSSLIQQHSASFTQNQGVGQDKREKTAYQVMTETNAISQLVSSGLEQAYQYQTWEYREILRRFFKKDSRDMDVRTFRAACLEAKIPEKYLIEEVWDIEPEQVMGAGNKTLEMAISKQLMEWRPLYNPTAQNDILRKATLAITSDAKWADSLVPEQPKISNTVHDTELTFNALMSGNEVTPIPGLNNIEVAGTMLRMMGKKVQQIKSQGAVGTPKDLQGFQLADAYATKFIGFLAQDEKNKELVTKLNKVKTKIENDIRGFAQRQQKMAEAAAQQNGHAQMDPKDQAKIMATQAMAQQKIQTGKESSAAKTAQRNLSFQEKFKQDQQRHQLDMQTKAAEARLDMAKARHDAALDVAKEAEKAKEKAKAKSKLKSGDDGN